ncbi:MAG: hypothetical protein LUD50_06515 [Clostridia bacterium]|nr:hypothetical protein [Clostridia bacterium]
MTIHHDKFAYGKLKSCDEQLSQDALSKLIRQMNSGTADTDSASQAPSADTTETPAAPATESPTPGAEPDGK